MSRRLSSLSFVLVLVLVFLAIPAAVFAGGATVQGTVKVAAPIPTVASAKIAKDVATCGAEAINEAIVAKGSGELANVVVWLQPVVASGAVKPTLPAPATGPANVDQVGCRYQPHVQALGVGSELTLVNSDRVLHNVHGNLQNASSAMTVFNVAMPIKGQKLPTKLARSGLIRLQCDAGHAWMNAWIYVFDHALFAVTDKAGHFSIAHVPAGTYNISYWHEPLDGKGAGTTTTSRVVVDDKSDKGLSADITLKL